MLTGIENHDYNEVLSYYNSAIRYYEQAKNTEDYTTKTRMECFRRYQEDSKVYNKLFFMFSTKYPKNNSLPPAIDIFKGSAEIGQEAFYLNWFE